MELDAAARRWTGLPASRLGLMCGASLLVGAGMEFFMLKVWIKDTNCAPAPLHCPARARLATPHTHTHATHGHGHGHGQPHAIAWRTVYEVVKKKEAEKRATAVAATAVTSADATSLGEQVRMQWAVKRKEVCAPQPASTPHASESRVRRRRVAAWPGRRVKMSRVKPGGTPDIPRRLSGREGTAARAGANVRMRLRARCRLALGAEVHHVV